MLTLIRAMDAAHLQTPHDILFVGNVGEEGKATCAARSICAEGQVQGSHQVVHLDRRRRSEQHHQRRLGSKRYRVTFKGPGGHSYGAFGLVSPSLAMGGAIAKLSRIKVPAIQRPRSMSAWCVAARR
jgi:metal-dependent amidase/aminoacylase/carboxypeptidase family protein